MHIDAGDISKQDVWLLLQVSEQATDSEYKTADVMYSIRAHSHPLLPLLDLVLVGVASTEDDFFGLSLFSRSIGSTSSDKPPVLAANVVLPALFLESTRPISGISDASHCWKGFATKKPLTSNHRVKGEESSSVFVSPSPLEYSTLML